MGVWVVEEPPLRVSSMMLAKRIEQVNDRDASARGPLLENALRFIQIQVTGAQPQGSLEFFRFVFVNLITSRNDNEQEIRRPASASLVYFGQQIQSLLYRLRGPWRILSQMDLSELQ